MEGNFLQQASEFLERNGFILIHSDTLGSYYKSDHHAVQLFTLSHLSSIQEPNYFPSLKKQGLRHDINLIFIWEDRWLQQTERIKRRLLTLVGNFKKIPARKTSVKKVDRISEKNFFESNHYNLFTSMPNRFGLFVQSELVALTTFDRPRKWKKEHGIYVSLELIRFACQEGTIVQGGLSKLIKHVEKIVSPDDIMTYVDLDWSDGKGFQKVGFEAISETGGLRFYVNPVTMDRIRSSVYKEGEHSNWIAVYNCGNLKLVKKILKSKI